MIGPDKMVNLLCHLLINYYRYDGRYIVGRHYCLLTLDPELRRPSRENVVCAAPGVLRLGPLALKP